MQLDPKCSQHLPYFWGVQTDNAIGLDINTSCFEHYSPKKVLVAMNNQIREIPGYYYGMCYKSWSLFVNHLVTT